MQVGVIGAGAIARRGHLPALNSLEGIELIGLADVDNQALRSVSKRFGVEKTYNDYKEMLRTEIDAVIVCVPTQLHSVVVVDAANAGKHVLVEKPLSSTTAEAQEIVAAAKRNAVIITTVQNYRYFPAIQEMYRRLADGRIGRLLSIDGACHTRPPMSWTRGTWLYQFGGVLDDFAPHIFDMACWFANSDIADVHAYGDDYVGNMQCINHALVSVRFENNTLATTSASWLMGTSKVTLGLYGTGGTMMTDIQTNNFVEAHGFSTPLDDLRYVSRKMLNIARLGLSGRLFQGAMQFYPKLLSDFFRSIERKSPPIVSLEESARVVAILDTARAQLRSGRSEVSRPAP
jgi:predicted dehydrogenase